MKLEIEDALFRIKDLYDRTDGKCCISFSGGKDSTIVAELYLMALERNMVGYIPIIFADTKVEYDAIYKFVEWFSKNKQEVIYLKPERSFVSVINEYGLPFSSKIKSQFIATIKRDVNNPFRTKRGIELVTGIAQSNEYFKDGIIKQSRERLANKYMHIIHPDNKMNVSSKCCDYLKKKPFYKYYKENDINGYITGIRISEGGVRSMQYTSCTSFKKIGKKEMVHKMPIYDWTDAQIDKFILDHNIKISEAYTVYGLSRTGCIGCPYAKDIKNNLEVLYKFEPKKYKWVIGLMKETYVNSLIELEFDDEYMKYYYSKIDDIKRMRYEMLSKYRKTIAYKWKTKTKEVTQ